MKAHEREIVSRIKGFTKAVKEGKVGVKFTCRTVTLDLNPVHFDASTIAEIRKSLGASQAVFAKFLGVSTNTVQAWELATNHPSQIACRFLDEIRRNIGFWRKRLSESIKVDTSKARKVGKA